jgi:ABC-type glycerol-3-phosphate transport system substrate-binding protein
MRVKFVLKKSIPMLKKSIVFALVLTMMSSVHFFAGSQETMDKNQMSWKRTEMSYYDYYNLHQNKNKSNKSILKEANEVTNFAKSTFSVTKTDGENCAVINKDNSFCEWKIDVEESGLYNFGITYFPLVGSGQNIELSVYIDGQLPFTEAQVLSFPRFWVDKSTITKDAKGNDIRPEQIESPHFYFQWTVDKLGLYDEPYWFYIEKGAHLIRLSQLREDVAIKSILFATPAATPDYDTYINHYKANAYVSNQLYTIQAENSYEKNSAMLAPTFDTSNAGMTPLDPNSIRLNSIGRDSWNKNGQTIAWKVPDDIEVGLYALDFRVKQRNNARISSYRNLYINGKIPFAQAQNIAFPYQADWYIKTLGGNAEKYVYLKKGDILSLEATTGDTKKILRDVSQAVFKLNSLYSQIVVITGVNPDVYRDYNIELEIPNLLSDLQEQGKAVDEISKMIKALMGKPSSQSSILDQLKVMLDSFVNSPEVIPENIIGFKNSIDGMASIIYSFNEQALELDCIYIRSRDVNTPKANPGFFKDLIYNFKKFYASFIVDYKNISNLSKDQKVVKVWANTGRDQAQIISRLITDSFTPQSKIQVDLNLVSGDTTLIQAVLAGKGPDVTIMMPMDTPINLALRGAAVNLTNFKLSEDFKKQFYESAWTPFYYKGGLYAIPETQTFDMLFYRKDILKSLHISLPKTWDEFYEALKALQSKNLQIGILEIDPSSPGVSAAISTFDSFLFQNGGRYFGDDLVKTEFDKASAFEAFDKWVDLFGKYGLDRAFDFANRIKTGEMPLGITSYKAYTTISAIAPELGGLWDIAPIPGTQKRNGIIDRSTSSVVTGSILLRQAEEKGNENEAFEFMLWWTGSNAQTIFSQKIEATMGIAARNTPANKLAFEKIGWTQAEAQKLTEQWQWVKSIPQVPGGYLLNRSLTNAVRRAVDNREESRRMFSVYNKEINDELERKRLEFEKNH